MGSSAVINAAGRFIWVLDEFDGERNSEGCFCSNKVDEFKEWTSAWHGCSRNGEMNDAVRCELRGAKGEVREWSLKVDSSLSAPIDRCKHVRFIAR